MRFFIILLYLFFLVPSLSFAQQLNASYPSSYSYAANTSAGGVKGFFQKLFNKNKKQKKIEAGFDLTQNGYSGTLPSVESEFDYKTPKTSTGANNSLDAAEFLPDEFQKSKIDDPLFLDVILNKDRPGQYTQDMLRIMKFLESFRPVVANHEPVQKFNANVNLLDLHTRRIEKLYSEKPEGMSQSYYMLLNLAYRAKILGNLKFDANYYSKFSPVTGTQYDPEYIVNQDNEFLIELDKTIFQIRQLNN